ncbi:GAD-like domain protein [compost metagenome]
MFLGDPELDPTRMIAFGYNAFGNVDIWYGDATIRLNLPNGMVRVEPRGYDEDQNRQWTDEVMIGLKLSFNVSPYVAPWEDEKYQNMMPQALKALGELEPGEVYGFVPALSVGGRNTVKNLQKVKLKEHLLLLASFDTPTLYDYAPPSEGGSSMGEVTPLRKIGAKR